VLGRHPSAPAGSARLLRFPDPRERRRRAPEGPAHPDLTPEERSLVEAMAAQGRPDARHAWALWALAGVLGGHRLYLGPWWLGTAMLAANAALFAALGLVWLPAALLWWLGDAFWLPGRIETRRRDAEARAVTSVLSARLPPAGVVVWLLPRGLRRSAGR
jgi:hypothetical protein